jgi:hypothetical protein
MNVNWKWLAIGVVAGWATATWAPKFIPKLSR